MSPRLVAYEFTNQTQPFPPENILITVGGLGDGLLTVPYFTTLAESLPHGWSLAQALLSSSYTGWATGSISKDAIELAACVSYFQSLKSGKVVLLGHSTGCQDLMEYLTGDGHETRPPIDGAVLQAPVSDREALSLVLSEDTYRTTVAAAQRMVDDGRGEEILPSLEAASVFGAAVCARRWLSLASPSHDAEDDYFSSDLTDKQLQDTFGKLPPKTSMCILYMGSDAFVPPSLDKKALVDRWIGIAENGGANVDKTNSGVVEGASHDLRKTSDEVLHSFIATVVRFLNGLPSQARL